MSYEQIKVWEDGPVTVVSLNRPEKGNAISKRMAEEVQAAMTAFAADDAQRAAVLTAEGTKAFSFGADVTEPPELWRAVPNVGWQTNKPLVAAVEGWCIGGALVLAMMADLAVCGAKARFYYPEAKLGLTGGMIAALPARIPHKIAMELMLLCRVVEAERAERVGLVNEVVPEGAALAKAVEWAKEMAGFAPLVTGGLKRMVLDHILPRGPSEQWALHGARLAAIRESEDFREGSAAFREKRSPQFHGR
ncbi:enoyl-CoA hydratase/isomerase family protein [Paracraurococcus lichenis]|uniref:Enoyl-CoA hydratase/isomerase family protein n=1 Tax=Paracraurococcus lichenis TaxID=3064888 RepID=A0ABT9E1N6_9PROT|nr:enoyl-CoA hydratase/isomerase family protein [Paracraurococcus sp. LOR1-02]MDO9710081.1 enoyl-CoA hydratase/isomerase family protein [Paracraurococcus sp. LOR1-02]